MADEDAQAIARFTKAVLTSGDTIDFNPGITVIVGPNNVGKTRFLLEIGGNAPLDRPNIVQNVDAHVLVDHETFIRWFEREFGGADPKLSDPEVPLPLPNGTAVYPRRIPEALRQGHEVDLVRIFLHHLDVERRANLTNVSEAYDPQIELPSTPQQHIWHDPTKEQILNDAVFSILGEHVSVHRARGTKISLHTGTPESKPWPNHTQYVSEMARLPEVSKEGHGKRSVIGMLLEVIAGASPVLLIDEPELFLHPPQARALGRVLSQFRDRGTQIILATHSADILQGLVSALTDTADLTVVRMTRSGDHNHAAQIDPATIVAIARDPLLRHSSILDGLFYQGTVVCESGGDCMYYRAVLDHLSVPGEASRPSDVHFTHCSGKSRVHSAVRALRAARVPVVSIVDIDILQEPQLWERLLAAHGLDAKDPELEKNVATVRRAINQDNRRPKRRYVREEICELLKQSNAERLSGEEIQSIRSSVKYEDGWKEFKRLGEDFLKGDSYQALRKVLDWVKEAGLFVVPVGELESFHRDVNSGDKNAWLANVLEGDHIVKNGRRSEEFVWEVVRFLSNQTGT
jgi:predicted ATPase